MAQSNIKRVARLLNLVSTLQSGKGLNADGVAEACGISRRTVFRDIESLRAAGVPIDFNNDSQRYRLDATHYLPPTNFSLEEALALIILIDRASPIGPETFATAAREAATKIEMTLSAPLREQLRELTSAISMRTPPTNPLDHQGEVYNTIFIASLEKRRVHMHYGCQTDYEDIETDLKPYHMAFHQRSWFVIGHSSFHDEIRTFNLSRVTEATLLEDRFRVPKSFSIDKHFGNAWGMIKEPGPDQMVRLRFSSLVARNVSEVLWHPKQKFEFAEDGSLEYQVQVSGLREIIWWIMGYGDQVEVIGPAKLRKQVAQRHRNAAGIYKND